MAYSDFLDLIDIEQNFGINNKTVFFTKATVIPNRQASAHLLEDLSLFPFTLSLFNEKARSEFLITPVLKEVWKNNIQRIMLFSGANLDYDKSVGLNGVCDFLIQKGAFSIGVRYPIICLVEAKNQNIGSGIAQCIAEMYAAQQLNKQHDLNIPFVYGVITDGQDWYFLRLEGKQAQIDSTRYDISNIDQILGVFDWLIDSILAHFPEED
jgi:hypothetical protein